MTVDGRDLWAYRSGTGSPVVVFMPGAGGMGLDFLLAHDMVAELTTSVIYDRAGTGWSDDVPLPRGLDDVVDELRALLRSLGLPGPCVLVGHSLGGAYVHRYAQRFPEEVSALLLLDPAHPDWDAYMPDHLKMATTATLTATGEPDLPELTDDLLRHVRAVLTTTFAPLPDCVREQLVDRHVSAERLLTGVLEGANVLSLLAALREGGPLPDVPLVVLSATAVDANQTMFQPEDLVREQIAASHLLYEAVVAQAPRGEHRSVDDASHVSIPMARPDAVAQAVRDLLRAQSS